MAFIFEDGELALVQNGRSIKISKIAEGMDKPFFVYDLDAIESAIKLYLDTLGVNISFHYAMKANNHPIIMKHIASLGVGVDLVSGGELSEAIACGFAPNKIVFSGVAKSKREIEQAINIGIKQLNVESPAELMRIASVAKTLGKKACVALRMNPDVNPDTHPYIKTGFRENKFGMDSSFIPELLSILDENSSHLQFNGLTLHIGSQLQTVDPFIEAVEKTLEIAKRFEERGYFLSTFDVGGGIGIDYTNSSKEKNLQLITAYGQQIKAAFRDRNVELLIEPGRSIVGAAGILCGEVQYIKQTPYKNFVIVNTGMHHLMRPCLYQAYHHIEPVVKNSTSSMLYDVVGPICESSDVIGSERYLPLLSEGDWISIFDAGAYGAVMASNYNSHPMAEEFVYYRGERIQ